MSRFAGRNLTAGSAARHSLSTGDNVALEGLWGLAAGLTLGFGAFGVINILRLQGLERLVIVPCNFALSIIYLALWLSLIRGRIKERWANALIAGALLLAFADVLLLFSLIFEPLQNNTIGILIIAAGCFLLSVRWLALTIGVMLVTWAPVAWHVTSSTAELTQFALTQFAACILAVATHTARLRADRRLRGSEEKYRQLFQQSHDAVTISTPDGRLLDVNEAGLELFGYAATDRVSDISLAHDVYADPRDRERLIEELLAKGFVKDHESNLKTKSGEILTVEGTTSTIHGNNGKIVAFLAILRDITKRKREQKELARHREQLADLVAERTARLEEEISERKRAEKGRLQLEKQFYESQKLESLGVLAGGIAHDFNNLLVGIMGNASLLRREIPESSPHRSNLEQIEIAGKRAAELANEMLAYAGQAQFLFEICDLSRIVQEVANLLHTSISKKAVLDLGFTHDLPAIEADITQVRQVVMNLITNASDALAGESGTIKVRTSSINVDRDTALETSPSTDLAVGRYVCLEVSDTGYGMSKSTRAKIFDPFFTTKFDGRGLGLAAVLGIVRGHRASIQVDSEPEHGSTFKILFPASHERVETKDDRQPETNYRSAGGEIVLLVDDEEIVRLVSQAILEQAGITVLVAKDGREALEIFGEHDGKIDLVILDSRMPRMNGAQTFCELRQLQADIKVMLCSGDPEKKATHGIDGLAGFLRKPYDAAIFMRKVQTLLEIDLPRRCGESHTVSK